MHIDEIALEIGHFCTFQTTVTLTLDRAIWHTVVYHSLTSTYTPNFAEIGITFCGWTMNWQTNNEIVFISSTRGVDLQNREKIGTKIVVSVWCDFLKKNKNKHSFGFQFSTPNEH